MGKFCVKACLAFALLAAVYASRTSGVNVGSTWDGPEGVVVVNHKQAGFVYFTNKLGLPGYVDGTMFKIMYARINKH